MNRIHPRRFHGTTALWTLGIVITTLVATASAADMTAAQGAPAAKSDGPLTPEVIGHAFTYQGRLETSGSPADGPYDLQFRLMDAAAGGSQIGGIFTVDDAPVSDGVFTVELDFGANAFAAGARWLEISVRPGAGGSYTLLSPRQKLNPAPLAQGIPNVYVNANGSFVGIGRDFQVSLNEVFGLQANNGPGTYGGMYINTDDATGWPFYGFATGGAYRAWTYWDGDAEEWHLYAGGERLIVPSGGGLEIANTSTTDGLRINDTADDGVQIGSNGNYPNYGVYIPSPGVPNICLLIYTSQADGNYALYTSDNIEAGTVTFTGQRIIVRADGGETLQPGDVVVASGVDEPLDGGHDRLALVRRAGADLSGVIGVVGSRMEWQLAPGKDGERVLMPAAGQARAGDLVALVTQGVAEVRVQRGAAIVKGARLTASGGQGGVRALRTESLNGMPVSEGAPVIGVALADAATGGTVPVFVNVH